MMKKLSIKMRVTLWFTLFYDASGLCVSVFLVFSQRKFNSLNLTEKINGKLWMKSKI